MGRVCAVLAGSLVLTCSDTAGGQTPDAAAVPVRVQAVSTSSPDRSVDVGPLVTPFVQYGAPQRLAGGVSVLFPIGEARREQGAAVYRGLELQASAGRGGWRVAAGPFRAGLPWWWTDVLLTVTRTRDRPRGAFPQSTYVGVEAGAALIMPVNEFIPLPFAIMVKPSLGFGHRLDAPAGLKRTMFTWSVGAHVVTKGMVF